MINGKNKVLHSRRCVFPGVFILLCGIRQCLIWLSFVLAFGLSVDFSTHEINNALFGGTVIKRAVATVISVAVIYHYFFPLVCFRPGLIIRL